MNNQTTTSTSGISTAGLLGVAFVVLKLCHVINWSWWLVLLPFYGVFALLIVILLVVLLVAGILDWLDGRKYKKQRKNLKR